MKQVTFNIPEGQRIGEAIWSAIYEDVFNNIHRSMIDRAWKRNREVGKVLRDIEDQDLLAKLK